MERIRAFIALNLPVTLTDRIAALQRDLSQAARTAGTRVAWVPPPNLHITLKFLGELPQEVSFAVRDRLRECLGTERLGWSLQVERVDVFPNDQAPRVIWVGVTDEGQTAALVRDIEQWMSELGFANEPRPFHPHITLGRVKEGVEPFWRASSEQLVGRCSPSEVVLYRSVLQRQGAEYDAIARFALRIAQET